MDNKQNLEFLYVGTTINAENLKFILEKNDINVFLRNDSNSALSAGFGITNENSTHIYVLKQNIEKARNILNDFLKTMEE